MRTHLLKSFLFIIILSFSSIPVQGQYVWTKYSGNPVLTGSGNNTWDKHVFGPCVIFNADSSRYEMFYSASYGPESGWYPYRIGVAYSTDKINWTKYSGNPVMVPTPGTWDSSSTDFPTVIRENGMYKMWYSTRGGDTHKIGYATSPNGLTWTKHPAPVLLPGTAEWEVQGVTSPLVLKETSGYVMYYSSISSDGNYKKVGRATSPDGINWQKDTVHNPVLSEGSGWEAEIFATSVVKTADKYYMYYTGTQKAGGLAISTDGGLTFQKYANNPILNISSSGWDNNLIETGWVILEDSVFSMWYEGYNNSGEFLWKIGMATSPLVTNMLNAGTYTVGSGGDFTDISSAFEALRTHFITGPVTLELKNNEYTAPADSFGFKLTGPIAGAGPNCRVTIKPAQNKNVTIQGSGRNVITLLNASYVDLDGFSTTGSTTLTIHSLQNAQFDRNNAAGIYNNSDHNNIRNLVIVADDYLRISMGIYITGGTQYAPDFNKIENNFIKKAGVAILLDSYLSPVRANNNIIDGNIIGSETDSLISWGIQSQHTHSTTISNNHVQNIRYGIHYECPGIDSYCDFNCKIFNNVVHNIDGKNSRDGAFGIELSGDSDNPGDMNQVYNNMVYDIRGSSTRISGIQVWYVNNSKIYYNTVYLSGQASGNVKGSAALYISHQSTNIDAKNNILVNTRDESPYCASSIYDYSADNLASDYNDLFYQTSQSNCLVRIGNTDYLTMADWRATGKDMHSITEMPNFVLPHLHIATNVATYLEGRAIKILGFGYDIDGDARDLAKPDIGADEFNGIAITGVEDEQEIPTEFALEQNYPNPFNPTTTIRYSVPTQSKVLIKVYDMLGNETAVLMEEEKPAGSYELNWNAEPLPSGVYFYQLRAGEFVLTKKMSLLK